jgi:hypothetical protein
MQYPFEGCVRIFYHTNAEVCTKLYRKRLVFCSLNPVGLRDKYFSCNLSLYGGRQLPTVHLSIPDKMYQELKARAASMGIQVTDIIKMFIQFGLKNGLAGMMEGGSQELKRDVQNIESRLTRLEKKVNTDIMYVKGKVKEFEEMFNFLIERMDQLEELMEKVVKQKKLLYAASEE